MATPAKQKKHNTKVDKYALSFIKVIKSYNLLNMEFNRKRSVVWDHFMKIYDSCDLSKPDINVIELVWHDL